MKTITTPTELNTEFKRLMNAYKCYYWSVAWADFNFELSDLLVKNETKIKNISVGLAFYGTSEKFISKFKSHTGVNFIADTSSGTFHPKVYLFQNSETDFELLIGSANFTNSAFNKNTEFDILINAKDKDAIKIKDETLHFIKTQWNKGVVLTDDYIKKYTIAKNKLKPLPALPPKGFFKPVYSKSWEQYLKKVSYKEHYQEHLKFLNWVDAKFKEQPLFDKMDLKTRKSIAGFGREDNVSTGCFGSTGARGYFKQSIIDNPKIITKALAKIPKQGIVLASDYNHFITEFKKISKQDELACATRFLCLWRPDYFVNFNGINANSLCNELRISKNKVKYDTYWSLIVEPLINADWSQKQKFKTKKEEELFSKRIALLDCIHSEFL
ncbi:MAG: phospholipase D family protein [Bacteroidia bacterium]